ncbi:MAG: hypothetical protein IKR11_03430 [Solobacterium sp.]|nr:hypothetical protein [Solobacterium sp.]
MEKRFLDRFDEMMRLINEKLPVKAAYRIVQDGETCDEYAEQIHQANWKHYERNQEKMIGNWCFFKIPEYPGQTCNLSLDDVRKAYDMDHNEGWENLYTFLYDKLLLMIKASSLKINMLSMSEFDSIKDRLSIALKPFEERMERENVCRRYGDIAFLLYVEFGDVEDTTFSYRVEKKFLEMWKKENDELFRIALENMKKKYPVQMFTCLQDIDNHHYYRSIEEVKDKASVTMTCNEWRSNGAVTIFYPGMMEEIYKKFGPFYAVFTSNREVNIHKMSKFDYYSLRRLLAKTDRAFLEGKISDTIFVYDPQKGLVACRYES